MFGHDEEQQQNNTTMTPDATLGGQPAAPAPVVDNVSSAPAVGGVAASGSQDYIMTDTPGQPVGAVDDGLSNEATAGSTVTPTSLPAPAVQSNDDLLSIKQQALQQLTPLVGHLDQSPEEKFRTSMMMIQASDNEALIKDAYEAAQNIADEKTRAQALLDIVNEINYFTQNSQA